MDDESRTTIDDAKNYLLTSTSTQRKMAPALQSEEADAKGNSTMDIVPHTDGETTTETSTDVTSSQQDGTADGMNTTAGGTTTTTATDQRVWQSHCQSLTEGAWEHFAVKRDRHGVYAATGEAYWGTSELTQDNLAAHFAGELTLGCGSTSTTDQCLWVALDLDNHVVDIATNQNLDFAIVVMNRLAERGVQCLIEHSDGKGGIHLWVLFSQRVPSADAHRYAKWIAHDYAEHGLDKCECFPKQASVKHLDKQCGNYLRLPGKHHKRDHWSQLWGDGDWLDAEQSVQLLLHPPLNDPACLAHPPAEPPPKPVIPYEQTSGMIARDGRLDDAAVIERARKYVAKIPGAVSEQHGHDATFSVACTLVIGFDLTKPQALDVLSEWNTTCQPPWTEADLLHKIDGADKQPGERGLLRNSSPERYVEHLETACDNIANQGDLPPSVGDTPAGDLSEPSTPPLPSFDSLGIEVPGLIGDIIAHNLSTAIYPLDELAMAAAISLMSVITGGKVQYARGRTNLFSIGLAPSGAGKDHGRKLNRQIMLKAGHPEICGPERIGSHAGIVTTMAGNWRTLFQIDEIGFLVRAMKNGKQTPHLEGIAAVLMQLYTSADSIWVSDAYGDANKVKTLNYPHCVVYGTSVPEGFWDGITPDQMKGGLMGRMLVFENAEHVDYCDAPDTDIPWDIIERAREWMELKTGSGNLSGIDGGSPTKITATDEANDRLKTHAITISRKRKDEQATNAAIWSRVAEKTNKLALLFACSRWMPGEPLPQITIADADTAVKLNNYLTRRLLVSAVLHISENLTQQKYKRLLQILRQRSEWTLTRLGTLTTWLERRERREILAMMEENGEIVQELKPGATKPTQVISVRAR